MGQGAISMKIIFLLSAVILSANTTYAGSEDFKASSSIANLKLKEGHILTINMDRIEPSSGMQRQLDNQRKKAQKDGTVSEHENAQDGYWIGDSRPTSAILPNGVRGSEGFHFMVGGKRKDLEDIQFPNGKTLHFKILSIGEPSIHVTTRVKLKDGEVTFLDSIGRRIKVQLLHASGLGNLKIDHLTLYDVGGASEVNTRTLPQGASLLDAAQDHPKVLEVFDGINGSILARNPSLNARIRTQEQFNADFVKTIREDSKTSGGTKAKSAND